MSFIDLMIFFIFDFFKNKVYTISYVNNRKNVFDVLKKLTYYYVLLDRAEVQTPMLTLIQWRMVIMSSSIFTH